MGRPKKTDEQLVKATIQAQEEMNMMTVDEIAATKVEETEPQTKMSMKEIAQMEGIPYIEPSKKMPAFGTLPEKDKKKHAYDWEYVKGIYENNICNGEPVKFWLSLYPGDPDCFWIIPANRPVYVPRMVANHLENSQAYHTFGYVEKPPQQWTPDDFTHKFEAINTHYRGKFRPIGAFN